MATIVGINAKVDAIQRDVERQRRHMNEELEKLLQNYNSKLNQYDADAKRQAEKASAELREIYERQLREQNELLEKTMSEYKSEIRSLISRLEKAQREAEQRIAAAESSSNKVVSEEEARIRKEREQAGNSLAVAEQQVENLEQNSAVLLLDRKGLQVFCDRLKKIRYYIDRSMFQSAIALADGLLEDAGVTRERMLRQAKTWADNYSVYCKKLEEVSDGWTELKRIVSEEFGYCDGVGRYIRANIQDGPSNRDYIEIIQMILEATKTREEFDFEEMLKHLREYKELTVMVATRNSENSICADRYYINKEHAEEVADRTENFALVWNRLVEMNSQLRKLLGGMHGIVKLIRERQEFCDWFVEYVDREELADFIKDSRNKTTETSMNFMDQLLFTRLEFETRDACFWLNAVNTNQGKVVIYITEDGDSGMPDELENIQQAYYSETRKEVLVTYPDEQGDSALEDVVTQYFK